jgi:hypothetical protein
MTERETAVPPENRNGVPADRYELLEPGDCGRPLPVNSLVDRFLFAKFIGLVADTGGVVPAKVVFPRTAVLPSFAKGLVAENPNATMKEADGGLTLEQSTGGHTSTSPLARTVIIEDLDELLASRQVDLDGTTVDISLTDWMVRRLLAGRPAVTEVAAEYGGEHESHLIRLVVGAGGPAVTTPEVLIADLPRVLASGGSVEVDGRALRVQLDAGQIRDLRSTGRTEVQIGERPVRLVTPSTAPSTPGLQPAAVSQAPGMVPGGATAPTAAPTFELALYLPWAQTWTLRGYSRGALLNTVSLAPQEETTIEIFTWDRRRESTERSSSVEVDNSIEQSDTRRDTSDVLNESQSSYEFSSGVDGKFGVDIYDVIEIGGGVNVSTKDRFASLTRSTTGFVHESVVKSANKVKQSRQSKVNEAVEVGREERVSRTVRNPNMCHTLNLDYFELLASYEIKTGFLPAEAGLCVLIDNPIKEQFDRFALRVHEQPLRRALLQRELAPGFDAARTLSARERACQVACDRCICVGGGEPAPSGDLPESVTSWLSLIGAIMAGIESATLDIWFDILEISDYQSMRVEAILAEQRRWVYDELLRLGIPSLRTALAGILAAWTNKTPFVPAHASRLRYELTAAGGVSALAGRKLYNENKSPLERAIGNEYSVWRLKSPNPEIESEWLVTFVYASGLLDTFNDHGLAFAVSQFVAAYDEFASSQAEQQEAAAVQATRGDEATDAVRSAYGVAAISEALEREEALLTHLRLNGGYYRAVLWKALTPAAQMTFLRPLIPLGITEPRAVGLVGERLAFPIRLDAVAGARSFLQQLIEDNEGLDTTPRTETVTLPTPAVTAEARLGQCSGCEPYIEHSRATDLRLRAAQADQAEAEAARYQARLDADPPLLGDPQDSDGAIHVVLEKA